MIEKLKGFIGKSTNDEDMMAYVNENKIKIPKSTKLVMSRTTYPGDSGMHFPDDKNGVQIACSIRPDNPNLKAEPAKRGGSFYPVCTRIFITKNARSIDYKFIHNLTFAMTEEEIDKHLAAMPDVKFKKSTSGGTFGGVSYRIEDESDDNIGYLFQLGFNPMFVISSEAIKHSLVIFKLHDVLDYYNNEQIRYDAVPFIEWAVRDDVFIETPENKEGFSLVKNNVITGLEFINRYIDSHAIFIEDFIPEAEEFVRSCHFDIYGRLQRNIQYTYGFLDHDIIVHEMQKAYSKFLKNKKQ